MLSLHELVVFEASSHFKTMPPRKRPRDLNKKIESKERNRQKVYQRGPLKISIVFDGREIQNAMIMNIRRQDTNYVVGCVAWFTNKKILKCMAEYLAGVSIVTTNDRLTTRRSNQLAYAQLKACYSDVIRTVGVGKGRFKSLMHNKFVCGLDQGRQPIWVMNGSFNLTDSAVTNLENVMFLDDPTIANTFLEEFKRIYDISKPLVIPLC